MAGPKNASLFRRLLDWQQRGSEVRNLLKHDPLTPPATFWTPPQNAVARSVPTRWCPRMG